MTRYSVNYKWNGKKQHSEYKNFANAKNDAVRLSKDSRFEDVKVLVASFDENNKLHQVVYNF